MLHHLCIFVGLCNPPAPPVIEVVKPETPMQYFRRQGFEPPSEEDPDGRIPLNRIFRYDENGNLPEWWREGLFYQYATQKEFHKI